MRPQVRLCLPVFAGLVIALGATACSDDGGTKPSNDSVKTLFTKGVSELEKGRLDSAKALFERVVAKDPKNAVAHYDLGVIAQKRNDTDTALREYTLATTADPKFVAPIYNSAVIYGASDPQRAMTFYRRVIALQPIAPTAYLNLGLLQVANGMVDEGTRNLSTALKQDPSLANGIPPGTLPGAPQGSGEPTATPTR